MVFKIFDEVCQGLLFSETNSKSFAMAVKSWRLKKDVLSRTLFSQIQVHSICPFGFCIVSLSPCLKKNAPENIRLAAFGM